MFTGLSRVNGNKYEAKICIEFIYGSKAMEDVVRFIESFSSPEGTSSFISSFSIYFHCLLRESIEISV